MNIPLMLSFRTSYILSMLVLCGPAIPQDAPTTPGLETPVRGDPKHPIRLGENYPAESRIKGEEGISVVRILVDTDGVVLATQLVVSSRFARLDEASLATFNDARMIPATLNGKPVTTWVNIPIAWNVTAHNTYRPHKVNDGEIHIPIVQRNYRLKVGSNDYPTVSRSGHQEGDCTIGALIDKDGTPTEVTVSKSTGFATLDQACVLAIQQAPFIPARQEGEAIAASTAINMSWRLTR